jgi:hypothetical protein
MKQTNELPAEISKNISSDTDDFKSSFLGMLHENAIWDEKKYWALDKALYDMFDQYKGQELPRAILGPVTKIFSYTMLLISCNYDGNDSYKITNLYNSDLSKFRERVRLVFEGFLRDEMPKNTHFEKVNPLLVK